METESHKKAAIAVENLLAEALAKPFTDSLPSSGFSPIAGGEEMGLEGQVEVLPHPDFTGLTIIRANVRWGVFIFRKFLSLEAIVTQSRA